MATDVELRYGQGLVQAINTSIDGGYSELIHTIPTTVVSVIATADGLTTGLIPDSSVFVSVESDDANKQISLPITVAVGKRYILRTGNTGCELVALTPGDKANNVVIGATNELALAGSSLFICDFVAADNWTVRGFSLLGVPLLISTAALPTLTHTAPGTPDYAIQDLTQTTPWGFASQDEGNTVLKLLANLQAQINELRAATLMIPDAR